MVIPDSGVSLLVPEGAIKKGTSEQIYIALIRDDRDRPKLNERQTKLSPVIALGPPGITFLKPVILGMQRRIKRIREEKAIRARE